MSQTPRKYHQAAAAYLIYGLIYLAGAVYLARAGISARAMEGGSVWWFAVGGAMAIGLPVLIWKQFKWVTRILAVLVAVRVFGLARLIVTDAGERVPLPWGGTMPEVYGAAAFLLVAVIACAFLVRAGWGGIPRSKRSSAAASGG